MAKKSKTAVSRVQTCADFQSWPPGANFTNTFPWPTGFHFASLGGSFAIVVYDGISGIPLAEQGVTIRLPEAASKVLLRVGSWADTLSINAFDEKDTRVAHINVPGDDKWHSETMTAEAMTYLKFKGGGNEAALATICIEPA